MDELDAIAALREQTSQASDVRKYIGDDMGRAWRDLGPPFKTSVQSALLLCVECENAAHAARSLQIEGQTRRRFTDADHKKLRAAAKIIRGTMLDMPLRAAAGQPRTLSNWIEGAAELEATMKSVRDKAIVRRVRGDVIAVRLRYFVVRLHRYLAKHGMAGRKPGTLAHFATVALGFAVLPNEVLAILRREGMTKPRISLS